MNSNYSFIKKQAADYFQKAEYQDCIKVSEIGLKYFPLNPVFLTYVAYSYKNLNNLPAYFSALKNVLGQNIIDPALILDLGRIYLEARDYQNAKNTFKKLLEKGKNKKEAYYKYEKASQMLKVSPKLPKVLFINLRTDDERELGVFNLEQIPLNFNNLITMLEKNKVFSDLLTLESQDLVASDLPSKLSEALKLFSPNIVALAVYDETLSMVKKAVELLHSLDVFIILGGPFITQNPEIARRLFSKNHSFALLRGEAESTFPSLVKELKTPPSKFEIEKINQELLKNIPGLFFKFENKIFDNLFSQKVEIDKNEINKLPFNPAVYLAYSCQTNILNLHTSRGCPFNCLFCSQPEGRKFRAQSVKTIIKNIDKYFAALKDEDSLTKVMLYFLDNDFFIDPKRAAAFLTEVQQKTYFSKLKFKFQTSISALKSFKEHFSALAILKDVVLLIGTDSFVEKEVVRLEKAHKFADMYDIISLLEEHKIPNIHYTILSNIDTEWATLGEHIKNIIELHKKYQYFLGVKPNLFLNPSYGTRAFERILSRRLENCLEYEFIDEIYQRTKREIPQDELVKNFLEKVEIPADIVLNKKANLLFWEDLLKKYKKSN
jgi:radical SAM superfamily enzyme YgiQ (UPF0313 family)